MPVGSLQLAVGGCSWQVGGFGSGKKKPSRIYRDGSMYENLNP